MQKQTSTTTMKNLPAYAEPYVRSYLDRGVSVAFDAQYDTYFSLYTEPTYLDLTTDEIDGIEALASRARNGSPLVIKGSSNITETLSGGYLEGGKPEFQTTITSATVKPSTTYDSKIKSRMGGSLYGIGDFSNDNLAHRLSNNLVNRYNEIAAASIYKSNYDSERNNQNTVLPKAVEYSKESIKDAKYLINAGMHRRAWQHGQYKDAYEKWYESQVLITNRTEVLGNTIRALVGTQGKKTTPIRIISKAVTVAMGAASGAITGAIIGSYFPVIGTAIGAVIGAIVGGALAYFSS